MPPTQRTPTTIALERLAKLAAAGADPARMAAAVEDLLIQWAAEDLEPSDLRERVESLQENIDGGILAAEDYLAEADSEKGRAAAQGQLAALGAVRDRLAALAG